MDGMMGSIPCPAGWLQSLKIVYLALHVAATALHAAAATFGRHGRLLRFRWSRVDGVEVAGEKQIPCGNDNKKGKGSGPDSDGARMADR